MSSGILITLLHDWLQERQAAELQAQISAKERFIATLRRALTTAGSDTDDTNPQG